MVLDGIGFIIQIGVWLLSYVVSHINIRMTKDMLDAVNCDDME